MFTNIVETSKCYRFWPLLGLQENNLPIRVTRRRYVVLWWIVIFPWNYSKDWNYLEFRNTVHFVWSEFSDVCIEYKGKNTTRPFDFHILVFYHTNHQRYQTLPPSSTDFPRFPLQNFTTLTKYRTNTKTNILIYTNTFES